MGAWGICWVVVKELKLSYYIKEPVENIIYPYYGNLTQLRRRAGSAGLRAQDSARAFVMMAGHVTHQN